MVSHIPDRDSETIMANIHRVSFLVKAAHFTERPANIAAKMADSFLGNVIGIGKIALQGVGSEHFFAQLPIQPVQHRAGIAH